MKFCGKLLLGGKTATGIAVPAVVVEALGSSKRPAVRVTINGRHTYRNTVAPYGGQFMLSVSAEQRAAAGVAVGDEVDVELELYTEPRTVTAPDDFDEALRRDAAAKRYFESLSYSNRSRLVLAIEAAKAADTRERRIAKTIDMLREGRAQ